MNEVLTRIKEFAGNAHTGQKRKYSDDPYIVHPVRVMKMCSNYTNDTAVLASALLHDVLEDTPVGKEDLEGFLLTVMDRETALRTSRLVVELTDVYIKDDYPQWNRRKRKAMEAERMERTSPLAQTVKYADIMDNCKEIAQHDKDFGRVFLYECKALLKRMTKGDPQLYKKAVEAVEKSIAELKGGAS